LRLFCCALLVALTGCELLDAKACTDISIPGIRVTVLDSLTGNPLNTGDVHVVVQDGTYADSTRATEAWLAYDRTGTYTVQVIAPGYRLWQRSNIRVRKEESGCHVETVDLLARLQP
jgi:hypothetical protein